MTPTTRSQRATFLAVLLTLTQLCVAEAKIGGDEDCREGYVKDLDGNCVKRFVLPKRKPCPTPEVAHAEVELRGGGRMVNVYCDKGYQQLPDYDYAMCKMGKWDRALPACLKSGCPELRYDPTKTLSAHSTEAEGALMRFVCLESDHEMVEGGAVLGCDGEAWNGTAPVCRKVVISTTTTEREAEAPSSDSIVASGVSRTEQLVGLLLMSLLCVLKL